MTRSFVLGLVLVLNLVSACSPASKSSQLDGTNSASIKVENAWARATFAMAQTGAVYMTLKNPTDTEITLVSASVASTVAEEVQLHDMAMADGMMQMQQITAGVLIKPSETLEFQPGGKHIMLIGLEAPLQAGDEFELQLNFQEYETISVPIKIKDARNLN